jgi:hypothetical protein
MVSLLLLMTSRSPASNGVTQLVKLCMDAPSSGWAAYFLPVGSRQCTCCHKGWIQNEFLGLEWIGAWRRELRCAPEDSELAATITRCKAAESLQSDLLDIGNTAKRVADHHDTVFLLGAQPGIH